MDQKYIERKIRNCQGLVDNTLDEDRKKVYQGYLDFWEEKLENPKTWNIDQDYTGTWVEPEPEPVVVEPPRGYDEWDMTEGDEEMPILELGEGISPDSVKVIEPEPVDPEALFKAENPNKQAFYNRDEQRLKTKAYKEFLESLK